MFEHHPTDSSKMIHERLDIQRKEKADYSARQAELAKRRWDKVKEDKDANALKEVCQGIANPDAKALFDFCEEATKEFQVAK
jgi:hypothetical protein